MPQWFDDIKAASDDPRGRIKLALAACAILGAALAYGLRGSDGEVWRKLRAIEALAAEVADPDAAKAEQAVVDLGLTGMAEALPAVEKALADARPRVRAAAARALAQFHQWELVPRIVEMMKDKDVAVRTAANQALVQTLHMDWGFKPDEGEAPRQEVIATILAEYPKYEQGYRIWREGLKAERGAR